MQVHKSLIYRKKKLCKSNVVRSTGMAYFWGGKMPSAWKQCNKINVSIFADLTVDKKLLTEVKAIHSLCQKESVQRPASCLLKLCSKSRMDKSWPYYILLLIKLSILQITPVTSFYVSLFNVLLRPVGFIELVPNHHT